MSSKIRIVVSLGFMLVLAGCAANKTRASRESVRVGPNAHPLIAIPAGQYQVGASGNRNNPPRDIQLKRFWISDAETTNEQFSRFVRMTAYKTNAERRGYGMVALEGMLDWAWNESVGASWRWPHGTNGPSAASLRNHPVTQI